MAQRLFRLRGVRRENGALASGDQVKLYLTGTSTAAYISLTDGGAQIGGSVLTLASKGDADFWGPLDGADNLDLEFTANTAFGKQTVWADADARLDALETGSSSVVVRESLTQLVIDAKQAAGTGLRLAAGTHTVLSALNLPPSVPVIGEACDPGGSKGTKIQGTSGQDVFALAKTSGDYSGYRLENLKISGGQNQIVLSGNGNTATHLTLRDVELDGPSGSGVLIDQGAIEEWYLDHVVFQGGQYGFRKVSGGDADLTDNYIDKCTFKDCLWTGQTKSGVWVDATTANTITLLNPILVLAAEHGFYWRGGARGIVIVNANTEQCGTSGKKNRTTLTGTVSSGATSGTLASASGWATGDQITIAGAGPGGTDFEDTITLSGTTATWTTPTSTTVSAPKVTNAKWDEFSFQAIPAVATPAHLTVLGGIVASEASLGRLRYSFRMPGAYTSLIGVSGGTGNDVPAYIGDPAGLVADGGNLRVRTTNGREFDTGTQGVMESLALLGFMELPEQASAPSAPSANRGRLYVEDNGSGKSRFMVRFPSGAAQVVATEP